jgi:hypothetical protein
MVLLQSNDRFNEIAELSLDTGDWRVTQRSHEDRPTDGFYSILGKTFCAVVRSGGKLLIRIGETQMELTDDVSIEVSGPNSSRLLVVTREGIPHVRHEYSCPNGQIEGDMTPFVEDEDFDFGLFLSNLSRNPKRQAVLRAGPSR